jgi:hypothetical protein
MKTFVSYKYGDVDSLSDAALIRQYVEALGHQYVDGKNVERSKSMNPQIKRLIDGCDGFIAIHRDGLITDYLQSELDYALAAQKPLFITTNTTSSNYGLNDTLPLLVFQNKIDEVGSELCRELYEWRLTSIFGDLSNIGTRCEKNEESKIFLKISELNLLDSSHHRKDFNYSVILEPHDDPNLIEYYKASLILKFKGNIKSNKIRIESHRAGNNFHRAYKSALQREGSIYRYIIKVPSQFDFLDKHFVVKDFHISGNRQKNLNKNSDKNSVVYEYEISQDLINSCSDCLFSIQIDTIVKKDQNEFTMIFGYPIDGLNASLQCLNTDISAIDIVDVYTSRKDAKKISPSPTRGRTEASAQVSGWILPESAVIFIWKRNI